MNTEKKSLIREIEILKNNQEQFQKYIETIDEMKSRLQMLEEDVKYIVNLQTREQENSEDEQENSETSEDEQENSEDEQKNSEDEQENSEDEQENSEDSEDSDPDDEEIYKRVTLPIQNHITFPQSLIINKDTLLSLKKQKQKSIFTPQFLSNELCKFLKLTPGTCLCPIDVHKKIYKYIISHNLNVKILSRRIINMDHSLKKLFGITEHEDYTLTYFNLYQFLKPHYNQILPMIDK
jgi:chromatin remodeling complex protein RSC6